MTTWTPLGNNTGGGGGGVAGLFSVAPDLLSTHGGLLSGRGDVIDYSTFDGGSLDGFAPQHWDGYEPVVPISTTTYPTRSGSHALMMPLGDRPYSVAEGRKKQGAWSTAIKRLSNYREAGLKSISAHIAIGSGGTQNAPGWSNWGVGLDIQRQNNSTRGFFKAECLYDPANGTTAWYITNNSGSRVKVPGSDLSFIGENENKVNYGYVRLTIDESADSGKGGYYELQVNSRVFDLRGLGAGRGQQAPQAGNWLADYRGGFNPWFGIDQRTTDTGNWPDSNSWPTTMYIDSVLVTMNDKAAS